jgi:hypothetical protein
MFAVDHIHADDGGVFQEVHELCLKTTTNNTIDIATTSGGPSSQTLPA